MGIFLFLHFPDETLFLETNIKIVNKKFNFRFINNLYLFFNFFSMNTSNCQYWQNVCCSHAGLTRMTDSNVVLVDWSDWAMLMDYGNLVIQLPTAVPPLADWLNDLHDRGIVKTFSDVVLIGHSLGAHLVGSAGHRLNGTVSRIIGTS